MVLHNKEVEALAEAHDWENPDTLHRLIQPYSRTVDVMRSVNEIKTAQGNCKELTEQVPLILPKVNRYCRSIFKTDKWLMQSPAMAEFEGIEYLIGGRHRLAAVEKVLIRIADVLKMSHDEIFEQTLKVDIVEVDSYKRIPALVLANNGSRSVTKPEEAMVMAQQYAPSRENYEYVEKFLTEGFSVDEVLKFSANYFTKNEPVSTPTGSLKVLYITGRQLSQYILYGHNKPTEDMEYLIDDVDEFLMKADKLWSYVKDMYPQIKASKELAKRAISKYESNQ